ncbi:MAG: phosphoenolpyruvate synthase, partial [Chloroflexi bacterium]
MHLPTQNQLSPTHSQSLVLPFSAIDCTMLNLVGGKAANLGELTQAKLPVPPGFCVTTSAYLLIADQANLTSLIKQVSHADTGNGSSLANNASLIRASILATDLPAAIAEAITTAYHDLSGGESVPVAVRSSATAEDLPFASFAGQQDTYLNIVGVAAVLDAVRRCWASLWTERAISYRTSNEIDQSTVSLAVVIQRMVDAEVAGVLFTANPLTGCRRQMVIDANPGLGEAVVSGMVNPDHVVVDVDTGAIVERRFGDKRIRVQSVEGGGTEHISLSGQDETFCLTDQQIHTLVELGTQVEAYYGAAQDIEWAIDSAGQCWLVQARPITTLFPLPAEAAQAKDTLRVYLSVNVIQGVYRPLTPLGLAAFRLIASSIVTFMGLPLRDRVAGPPFVIEAAQRLFFDITTPLRNAWGRNLLGRVMSAGEARSARVFQELPADPRLALVPFSRPALIRRVVTFVWRARMPHYALQALLRPVAARARVMALRDQLSAQSKLVPSVSAEERMTVIEQLLGSKLVPIFLSIVPVVLINLAVMIPLTRKLLGNSATEDERQVVLRGLPYNPTTEMDLTLWHIAQRLSSDDAIAQLLSTTPSEQLAQRYRGGTLPGTLQR